MRNGLPGAAAVLAGYSTSPPSEDKESAGWGSRDFWLVRVDARGEVEAERRLGGIGTERLYGLILNPDRSVLLAGSTDKLPSGDRTTPWLGERDVWVVQLGLAASPRPPWLMVGRGVDGILLRVQGAAGRTYVIESSGSVAGTPGWAPVAQVMVGGPSDEVFQRVAAGESARFYRAWPKP